MFAGDQQEMFETQLADRRAFAGNFRVIQRFALDAVTHRKTTVGTVVSAQIGEIQRDVKAHRIAKALASERLRPLCQWFKVCARGR